MMKKKIETVMHPRIEKVMLEGSRNNYSSKELLQAMCKAAEDEIMRQSFSFGLSGVSKIQFINEDSTLTEQQKRAHKIGILLQAKKCKRYFSMGLTISGILLAFGLLFWWPLLIVVLLSFIWGLSWQVSIRGLIGNNSQAIKTEVEKLGGEQAISESSYWNEFGKASGISERD